MSKQFFSSPAWTTAGETEGLFLSRVSGQVVDVNYKVADGPATICKHGACVPSTARQILCDSGIRIKREDAVEILESVLTAEPDMDQDRFVQRLAVKLSQSLSAKDRVKLHSTASQYGISDEETYVLLAVAVKEAAKPFEKNGTKYGLLNIVRREKNGYFCWTVQQLPETEYRHELSGALNPKHASHFLFA